jgi:hypothetical protein
VRAVHLVARMQRRVLHGEIVHAHPSIFPHDMHDGVQKRRW